jgi:mannose-6-phosphate isomerase
LHAYLEGVNVELMANSDNVLRGGLTTKHIDVAELLNILTFEGGTPEIFDGHQVSAHERVYHTPAEEFCLSRIGLPAHGRYAGEANYGPKALLVLHGSATIMAAGQGTLLGRGSIVLIPAGMDFVLETTADDLVVFQAGLPLHARGAT